MPMLCVKPEGPAYDHVTAELKLPVPATVATNCTWVPMIAVVGVTVIEVIAGPVGGGGVVVPPPLPHPLNNKPRHAAEDAAKYQLVLFIGLPILPSPVRHSADRTLPIIPLNFDSILHLFVYPESSRASSSSWAV